jgi:hypothetical protein
MTLIFSSRHKENSWLSNCHELPSPIYDDRYNIGFNHVEGFFQLISLVVGLMEFSRVTPTQAKKKGGKSGLKLTDNEMSDWLNGRRKKQ